MVDLDEMFVWTFCGDEGHGILYGPYRDHEHADEELDIAVGQVGCDHHHAHWEASPRMVARSLPRSGLTVDRWSVYRRTTTREDGRFLAYTPVGAMRESCEVFEAIGRAYEELKCSVG